MQKLIKILFYYTTCLNYINCLYYICPKNYDCSFLCYRNLGAIEEINSFPDEKD